MAVKPKKKNKSALSGLITLGLCLAIVCLVCTMFGQQTTMSKLSSETKSLNKKIENQKEEKARIEKQLEEPNELLRIEQIAREQLGMLKPGERVFVDSAR